METASDELIPTRATLLERIKDHGDHASWDVFFATYEKLILGVALHAGLNRPEAEEVVQETMIAVAKKIPEFKYNRSIGSFKGWLLTLTRWRVQDQVRKRPLAAGQLKVNDLSAETALDPVDLELQANDGVSAFEAVWNAEWETNVLAAAINKVKRQLDPQKYQIFDFYVNKNWPAEKVAATFGVKVEHVYLAKHRVCEMIAVEIKRLELKTD